MPRFQIGRVGIHRGGRSVEQAGSSRRGTYACLRTPGASASTPELESSSTTSLLCGPLWSALFPEQPVREVEQAAEVEAVGGDQRVAIPAKEGWQPRWSGGQRGRRAIPAVRFRKEPVDQAQQIGAVRGQFGVEDDTYYLVKPRAGAGARVR